MSDANQRVWYFNLDDMIEFAGKVLSYTDGLDQTSFIAHGLNYDATLWSIIRDDVPALLPVLQAMKTEA